MSVDPQPGDAPPPTQWSAPEAARPDGSGAAPDNPWAAAAPPAAGALNGGPAPAASGWGTLSGHTAAPYGALITRRGIVAIKPLGLGDILDGAFRAIRHNPRVMIGLTLIVVALTTLLSLLPIAVSFAAGFTALNDGLNTLPDNPTSDQVFSEIGGPLASLAGGTFVGLIISSFGALLLNGLLIVSVGQSVVDRRISFGDAWRRVRGRIVPLFGQTVVIGLATGVPFLLAVLVGIVVGAVSVPAGIVVGVVLAMGAVVLAVYLSIVWSLGPPVLVLERVGPLRALGRSRRLLHHAFWRTLGILLLTYLLVSVLTQVFSVPIGIIGGLIPAFAPTDQEGTWTVVSLVVTTAAGQLITVLTYPFTAGVISLLYIDRRIRVEGLDVALTRAMADPA